MRLSSFVPLLIAFSTAAVGAYFAASAAVGALETNSRDEVDFQLRVAGHDWTEVQADGLQVIISGEAPSEADRFKAQSVAATVVDAARVIDNMSVFEAQTLAAPDFTVEMLRNEAGISLIGLVPASTDRTAIVRRLERLAPGLPITDLMEDAAYDAPEAWEDGLFYAVGALSELPRSKVSVSAGRVAITAAAETAQAQSRLQADLSRRAPEGVVAAVRISAPRPVITPFTLRFLIDDDGARFDSCAADTEAALDAILGAAVASGLDGKSDCRLGLGAPSRDWGEAASKSISALSVLGGGTVTLSDFDISLVATMGTDAAAFKTITEGLETALPAPFSLTAVLPVPEVETEEGPPAFTATLSPEGQVQMRGHLGDDLAVAAVKTYAQSRFGAGVTSLSHEPHSTLPQGWSLRALAGLSALAALERGTIEVATDTLSVRGDTGNQEARTRIAQILSEELGEGQAFSINVTYLERLDPTANIPTPDECLADIKALTDARKLTFEPGSTDLDANSRDTITGIAAVMRECPEFDIVIEGHTDSQGGEAMNLSLSQQRAEAVVTALRAERIAWAGLVPRGYGETNPISSNDTEEGREANRRIDFKFLEPVEAEPGAQSQAGEETESE
ncbi:MAG: OmpA family protein [Pseudomonadota bacterium]